MNYRKAVRHNHRYIFNGELVAEGVKICAAMQILCISRKYPPSVGGMQKMNYALIRRLGKDAKVTVIKWGHSQAFLPLFLIWAFIRSLFLLAKKPDVIYLGDALLAPLGVLIKAILRRPVAVTVHGRDIVFPFPLYRTIISFSLNRLDRVIGVSRNTTSLCKKSGVKDSLCATVHNGTDPEKQTPSPSDTQAAKRWLIQNGIELDPNRLLLITVGRLVRRKGIGQFVKEIMPLLVSSRPRLLYMIVGEGKEQKAIEIEIERRHLKDNVFMAGYLPDNIVRGLMTLAKAFIMPNITVDGDVEGFGIVVLEANCAELPVVAYDIEGLRDAIVDGKNGYLVEPNRPRAFAEVVERLLSDESQRSEIGKRSREFIGERYSWDRCARLYMRELDQLSPLAKPDSK